MIPLAAFKANSTYFLRTLQSDGTPPILMTLNPPHSTMADWPRRPDDEIRRGNLENWPLQPASR
ncbi:MAG: hypothetical protein U0992_10445 [Planctomycetaceae bacterium]